MMKNTQNGNGRTAHANGSQQGAARGDELAVKIAPATAPELTLITGGAGFIGTNVAHRVASSGERVLIFDNLSRPGVERNIRWLQRTHGERVQLRVASVLDMDAVREAVTGARRIFHFAAQVAVTTSLEDPIRDFEVNARGTLNVLEAARAMNPRPTMVFTSTNKVYGGLPDIALRKRATRYEPVDEQLRRHGVSESRPLECCSPYGCSKGCADQYVLDYARTFGLPALVFRMSCIYGPHQFGNEDQGWVAHFLLRALRGQPITIYGDGLQVRDILYVEDLVDAFLLAHERMGALAGHCFNMGGGPERTVSLVELMDMIEAIQGRRPEIKPGPWRLADQRYYVSDTSRFSQATGWRAKVDPQTGVRQLYEWLREGASEDMRAGGARRNPQGAWVAGSRGMRTSAGATHDMERAT